MIIRKSLMIMLCMTVLSPIVLYTERLRWLSNSLSKTDFLEDSSRRAFERGANQLNAVSQDYITNIKEPVGYVYHDKIGNSTASQGASERNKQFNTVTKGTLSRQLSEEEYQEHKLRLLYAANDVNQSHEVISERVTETRHAGGENDENVNAQLNADVNWDTLKNLTGKGRLGQQKSGDEAVMPDARVRYLKDQLIRAKVYISLSAIRNNPALLKELRQRMRDVQRAVTDASRDTDLPKNANEKMKSMENILFKAKRVQDDCSLILKKLRAILHSTEDQLRAHKRQAIFLMQLAAKTLPKGLHCLPLRLSNEYYSLHTSEQQFPNKEKLEDPTLYHYALFSDNILAVAVVVNSTVFHAKEPMKHVYHIVTDRLNYAAMRMWFLANPPGKATIQVQNIEEFTWLNSSYSPVLKQLESPAMIDYYFHTTRASSDTNLKYRNPKYLSILNHLRFYLPEIFPKLGKVIFLDDDIVVQKDLTLLWKLDLKGNVNGAVETCGQNFHRFDRYLNFSSPVISKHFDPHACGWAYGMNVFDLDEWRRQKVTEIYHSWQNLNRDRTLWKLGTLPPGLITFWNRTYPLEKSWHVLGLGYNPKVNAKEIERAAVIHYNGNLKPWLEIGIPQYKHFWAKFLDFDQAYLRECNINP